MNTIETTEPEVYSNFITPPSHTEESKPSVLIIDADWSEVEDIALWCRTSDYGYNIYLYQERMWDMDWLSQVVAKVDHMIINMQDSGISEVKQTLAQDPRAIVYATPGRNDLSRPVEFFIKAHDNS